MPSLFSSAAATSSAFAYRSGSASPRMSTGLLWLHCGGRNALSASTVLVESGVSEIASASRRAEIADRAVQLAQEDLRVIEERYGLGHATIIELQTSQVALADAEVAAVRSRQTLGTAVAQLEAVLGRTIQ